MTHRTFSPTCRIAFAILSLVFGTQLHAQYDNGSLVGTIRDASGAPIANADVKITNNDTAIVSEAKTNSSGDYEAPTLRVGVYTISASSTGFSEAVAQNITVSVGNRQHIDLTAREFAMLEYLIRRAGQVVPKSELLDHVWDTSDTADLNVVEVYAGYLRRKIDAPFGRAALQTLRGAGYRLAMDGG